MAEAATKAGANQAPFKPPSAIVDSSAMNMKLIYEHTRRTKVLAERELT